MGGRTGWKNWINAGARLVLLASGVYGCLLLLRSSDGIACSPWAVYGGTGVLCLLLWLSAGRGKGCVLALSALLLLGSGAALCREHPASDLAEATSVILSVLENSTSYTLTPGSAPVNTDIVEYFLFESREGYCVHYASAATLMYRLYGIPARYGAGYAVQPSDFVRQEDGTWVAEVTDESAHAWTEIFLEDYGWTPVEVTPASDGSMLASYPGFDAAAAVLPQVRVDQPSERGRDGEETAEGEPGADENENEDGAGEGLLSGLVSGASERQVWAGCADCGGWSRAGLWSSLPSSWICCISRDTWRGTRGRRRTLAQSWPAR